ncbi:hypothetical protein [Sphingobacterium sp. LRF_L2]|uniref:hypothetical protein n=1 Tax=Sphingobacterium sp. LRF_L2 TaxID=3369421 RepID=UPI003F5F3A39
MMTKNLIKIGFLAAVTTVLIAACDSTKTNKKNADKELSDTTITDEKGKGEDTPNTGCD